MATAIKNVAEQVLPHPLELLVYPRFQKVPRRLTLSLFTYLLAIGPMAIIYVFSVSQCSVTQQPGVPISEGTACPAMTLDSGNFNSVVCDGVSSPLAQVTVTNA